MVPDNNDDWYKAWQCEREENDQLRRDLAVKAAECERLRGACEQISLNLCYCEALGDAGPCFPCVARDALAPPVADAG